MWRRTSFIFVKPDSLKVLAYKQFYNGCRHSFGEGMYKSFLSTSFFFSVFLHTRQHVRMWRKTSFIFVEPDFWSFRYSTVCCKLPATWYMQAASSVLVGFREQFSHKKGIVFNKSANCNRGVDVGSCWVGCRFRLLPTLPPSFPHQTPRTHVAEDFLHLCRAWLS